MLRREREIKEKIQFGARRRRNAVQSQDDYFVWITQKEGNKNNNVMQKPIGMFDKKIQGVGRKNRNVFFILKNKPV